MTKLSEQLGRPLAVLLTIGILLLALGGTAAAALTVRQVWREIRPKADARYLQNTRTYVGPETTVGVLSSVTASVDCPEGWQALGGGVDFQSQAVTGVDTVYSGPLVAGDNLVAADEGQNPAATGWKVRVQNNDVAASYTFVVGVVCAK